MVREGIRRCGHGDALLAAMVPRVAAVRVILDTPAHEISPAWVNPRRAAADPRNWREAAWLARWVPRYTSARRWSIAAALEDLAGGQPLAVPCACATMATCAESD